MSGGQSSLPTNVIKKVQNLPVSSIRYWHEDKNDDVMRGYTCLKCNSWHENLLISENAMREPIITNKWYRIYLFYFGTREQLIYKLEICDPTTLNNRKILRQHGRAELKELVFSPINKVSIKWQSFQWRTKNKPKFDGDIPF